MKSLENFEAFSFSMIHKMLKLIIVGKRPQTANNLNLSEYLSIISNEWFQYIKKKPYIQIL
jgi:Anaphase promoting complex (APC) subunit 2